MSYMFCRCLSLKKLTLPKLQSYGYSNIYVHGMFGQCSKLLKDDIRKNYISLKEEAFIKYFE